MEDRDKIEYAKPIRLTDDCSKNRKNFTQGYYYREIGRYNSAVPSEFQWAAEDKLVNKTAYEELRCQLPDSPRSTFLMVFSPDGKKVASTHGNHNVYVTDLTTGKNVQTLSGHPRTPWCIAFHPSSNQILASGCLGGQVRVWDLNGGSEVWTTESQTVIASLAFHPVDRMLVIATYNELHFWDWSKPQPFAKCSTKSGREKVRYVSFDRLGYKLITGIANPVNVPSQWDRINVVSSQPLAPSSTTTTTNTTSASFNSSSPSTISCTQPSNDQGRSTNSWYRNYMNRYNQVISISRNIPTIDRGTDPMDLLDLRNSRNNTENSTSSSSPFSSNTQANPSSPLRFRITRSACRSYRHLERNIARERFRIHSSVFRRLGNRSSHSSNSNTLSSTSTSQSSTFTNPFTSSPTAPVYRDSYLPRLRRCAFSLGPTARSWCLTLGPENSSGLFTTRNTLSTTSTSAVTNPTFTSCPQRGIFSTRENSATNSERTQPYRLPLAHGHMSSQRDTQSEPERSNPSFSSEQTEEQRTNSVTNLLENSRCNRDTRTHSLEGEGEGESQRSNPAQRRQETVSSNGESPYSEFFRNNRSSVFQLIPVSLRNVSPARRFRDEANSDGELTENSRRESHYTLPQSLMHPRPVPRFQVRSRLFQDQQSQLHLLTNRETHGLNLQHNQSLRRQLYFRPGGQFVLSRHSNSPFQPRVPNQTDGPAQPNPPATAKTSTNESRLEGASASGSSNATDASVSSSSVANTFSSSSVATNLSFTDEGSCHQLPDQINRRLYDRVKMMLRDRIQNSSENASADSTVNYSRISGESEAERAPLDCEEGVTSRGLGPRGADPMLSSAGENLDSTIELLHSSGSSSPISGNVNGVSTNNSNLNVSQSELLDPWETDTISFSISVPLSLNDVLSDQSQPAPEPTSQNERNNTEGNPPSSASDNGATENSNSSPEFPEPNPSPEFPDSNSSPELGMTQGILLINFHIENLQKLCCAQAEILQLQKIKRMWEDLTNQIRHFYNVIQNRTSGENPNESEIQLNENSNSNSDIPSMSNLAISTSPVPERSPECSTSTSAATSHNSASTDPLRNNHKELVEVKASEEQEPSSSGKPSHSLSQGSKDGSAERRLPHTDTERKNPSETTTSSRNETEEPQPGPSGLSTSSASGSVRNPEYTEHKLLRPVIQKSRRRRESRELGLGTSSGFQKHNHTSAQRNYLRAKLRNRRYNRFDSSIARSRILSRESEAAGHSWKNEKSASKWSRSRRPNSSGDTNEPSTSTSKTSVPNDACQSCGQKRRKADSPSGSSASGSASKILRNNAGGRSEAPCREDQVREPSASTSASQTGENSANDLVKQMLETMETMMYFQREVFEFTKNGTKGRPTRQTLFAPSSGDDSDSDQNDSNEQSDPLIGNSNRSDQSPRSESVSQDKEQLRVKKMVAVMIKSLNQLFGKDYMNSNGAQSFCLCLLLDFAVQLTDLLLKKLNARSCDLVRNWTVNNPESRERNWVLSKRVGVNARTRERSQRSRYSTNREDISRSRFSTNPFSRLISSRNNSSGTFYTTHDRFSRRKITTARGLARWYCRRGRIPQTSSIGPNSVASSSRLSGGNLPGNRLRSFWRPFEEDGSGLRAFSYEINNNSNNNDTNNNYSSNDDRNNNNHNNNRNNNDITNNINNNNNNNSNSGSNDTSSNNNHNINNNGNNNNNTSNINSNSTDGNSTNADDRSTVGASSTSDINSNNSSFLNYYFPNSGSSTNNSESSNNIIIVTGLSSNSDSRNNLNNSTQSGSNASFLNQNSLPPLRSMELTLSRNESGDLSLRDERPIFWIRYGGNNETSGSLNSSDSQSRVNSFTVPVVQVNDVPVSDVSMLNQPRFRPQSPIPRVSEDIWRWRAWRPRFLHPRYGGPNPFDDQDSNDVPENIHYYRILSTSAGSHLGVYTLDPMIITEAPLSPHHRIQAWDFSKMKIPDISDREANGVVPECKIHNDASVDVSNDGHLLVTLLPSGRLSVTTMLGVYSLDWSSLGQLLYRTSFEQNAVSVSLSPTNRHLVVGLASRPVVLRDRTNMAQIFRLEGGRPSPHGGSWQSGRGRLVHIRDLVQTREISTVSLNCIRWAPGAGQGLVYGTNTGQLGVLR